MRGSIDDKMKMHFDTLYNLSKYKDILFVV